MKTGTTTASLALALSLVGTAAAERVRLPGVLTIDSAPIPVVARGRDIFVPIGVADEIRGRFRCRDVRCPIRRGRFYAYVSATLFAGEFGNRRLTCRWTSIGTFLDPEISATVHCDDGRTADLRLTRP